LRFAREWSVVVWNHRDAGLRLETLNHLRRLSAGQLVAGGVEPLRPFFERVVPGEYGPKLRADVLRR
jgi:hypothetical protein